MDDVFHTLAVFGAASLWGGLLAIDLVMAAALGNIPNLDQRLSNSVRRAIFQWWGWAQIWLAVLLLVIVVIGGEKLAAILPSLFVLALVGLQVGILEPTLQSLNKPSLSPEEIAANEPNRRQLHQAYIVADGFKAVLLALLLIVLVN